MNGPRSPAPQLVTGATGYMGGLVLRRLAARGTPVRAMVRDPSALPALPGIEPVAADLVAGSGLGRALDGCETAYYLVHSMDDPRPGHGFADRDRRAAQNFAEAALAAGLERIVYLGGIMPGSLEASPHLASRLEVEQTLLGAVPGSTALRASIVIGARSSSFRILVRLVERLRFMPLPAWRERRTQPIDERDAVEYLVRTPSAPGAAGRSLDVIGPDVLSYATMIERIAELIGVARTPVSLPVSLTPTASAVVAALTGQPLGLVRPLMESLEHDLLPRDGEAARIYSIRPRPFGRAVERALRDWEAAEPLRAR